MVSLMASGGAGMYVLLTRGEKIGQDSPDEVGPDYKTDVDIGWCLKGNLYAGISAPWGTWGVKSTLEYLSPSLSVQEPRKDITEGTRIFVGLFLSGSINPKPKARLRGRP